MPDLKNKTVMIIGAGPNIIGQSSECDDGALEATQALSEAGCRVITINSNPDAVMGEPNPGQTNHILPLTSESLSERIAQEKPHAILPIFSGRDGLHLAAQMARIGTLDQNNVALWGLSAAALEKILDRDRLKSALADIDMATPPIFTLHSMDTAVEKAQDIGFPVVLRSGQPDRIPDGILVYNQDELREKATLLAVEPENTISVEASLLDWQQLELEILRDKQGQFHLAGGVTYIDTAGIHPGDAIGISPPQGLSMDLLSRLTSHARAIADHLQIIGGATVRFAYPSTEDAVLVLAVHPRHTRTSAMVARITDVPIGGITGLLAAGFTLDALPMKLPPKDGLAGTSQIFAVKWPRFPFRQLEKTADRLGPQMQSVGQSVGYGSNINAALQKAARAATGCDGGLAGTLSFTNIPDEELLSRMATPASDRLFVVFESLRRGLSVQAIMERTHMAPWVVEHLNALAETDKALEKHGDQLPDPSLLQRAKDEGFSNAYLAKRLAKSNQELSQHLTELNIQPQWMPFSSANPERCFSTYGANIPSNPTASSKAVLLLGSGCHGIGQGPEYDYGLYQAIQAVQDMGHTPVVLNSNLSSVSTGPSMGQPCYCEPIHPEEVQALIQREKPVGVITQFAGGLAEGVMDQLAQSQTPVLGTPMESEALMADRAALHDRMRGIGIPLPMAGLAASADDARELASKIQFPLLVQPVRSQGTLQAVLIMDTDMLVSHLDNHPVDAGHPIWMEQFLEYAIEAQAETLCDQKQAHVAAVMEHIELAGVHAGDSACVLPPYSIAPRHLETIDEYGRKIALNLKVQGIINLRFAIYRDTVYFLEATSNASRNLSLVAHAQGLPLASLATRLMLGQGLNQLATEIETTRQFGVRAAVFPFNVFASEDPLLGPNMRATGQVLSLAKSFGQAYFMAQQAATTPLPTSGSVLITVTDEDKPSILEPARIFQELGFSLLATNGTHSFLVDNGIECRKVRKLGFGRPNLLDDIKNGGVQMVINTPTGGQGQIDDSQIRKTAIRYRIANITTPASALAAAKGIAAQRS